MENSLSAAQTLKIRIETQCILNQTKRKNEAHEWLKENHRQEYAYKDKLHAINLQKEQTDLQNKQVELENKKNKVTYKTKKREFFLKKFQEEVDS